VIALRRDPEICFYVSVTKDAGEKHLGREARQERKKTEDARLRIGKTVFGLECDVKRSLNNRRHQKETKNRHSKASAHGPVHGES